MNGAIVGLGILVLIVGVVLWAYPVEYSYSILGKTVSTWVEYPYRDYGFIVSLMGIIVLVVGLAIPKKSERSEERQAPVKKQERSEQRWPPVKKQSKGWTIDDVFGSNEKHCMRCGVQLPANAKYCSNCGQATQ